MWYANPKNWIIVGLAVALIGAGVYHTLRVGALHVQIATLKGEVTGLKGEVQARVAERDAATNTNAILANKVDAQNAQIEAIKAERDRKDAEYAVLLEESKKISARHAANIDAIRKIPVPANKQEQCVSAEKLVKEYIRVRQNR